MRALRRGRADNRRVRVQNRVRKCGCLHRLRYVGSGRFLSGGVSRRTRGYRRLANGFCD